MRVEKRHLVEQAVQPAFGARAVVARHVDHDRVVQFAKLVDRVDHTSDFMIGVGREGGEHLHHACVDACVRSPGASPRPAANSGRGSSFASLRNDADFLLPRERLLAVLCPSRRRTGL